MIRQTIRLTSYGAASNRSDMAKNPFPRLALLVLCTVVLAILITYEGWTWPLETAAFLMPIALLLNLA